MIPKFDFEFEPPKKEEEEEKTTTRRTRSTSTRTTSTRSETQQLQQELQDLRKFHRSHPDLPQPDILYEEPSPPPSEEEIESWEGSAQQSFWWETTPTVSEPKPKPEDPYSIMARKFIQRTPEGEVKHPEGKTPSLDTVPSIVEESYQKLVEEKTRPEFTFETMPRVMASGEA